MPRRSTPQTQHPQNTRSTIVRRALRVLRGTSFSVIVMGLHQTDPAITLVLTDHHFRLSAPAERGHLIWHVKNDGSEPHQALIVKLPQGVNEYQERAWIEHGSNGEEPGQPMGGIKTLAAGAEGSFQTDLTPGQYLLLCTMAEDEGRHYELGMIYRFTVE